jgi:uncharacterized protein YbjT (DUF2867 family)
MEKKVVFITGGTGYIGKRLIKILLGLGYQVTALVRQQSMNKLPEGCQPVVADPFDASSYADAVPAYSIFIHLLGVRNPRPKKKLLFYSVDLASLRASVVAAKQAGVKHFIYLSVAQYPTKIMADFQEARRRGEHELIESGLVSTFIRPWYVVGPGHYWPLLFTPVFKLLEIIPSTSVQAKSLALVSLKQILLSLKKVVTNPPEKYINIFDVNDIKSMVL